MIGDYWFIGGAISGIFVIHKTRDGMSHVGSIAIISIIIDIIILVNPLMVDLMKIKFL